MEKKYCVYCHVSPSGKRYIGITSRSPEKRWNYGFGYHGNEHFSRAIKKYGWNNFEHIVLCEGLTMKEASDMEIALIREYDTTNQDKGYNISLGGVNEGQMFSEEIGKKISEAKRGKPCPEWQREHLSKINKGKIPANLKSNHEKIMRRVEQFTIDGEYVATYKSLRTAGKECNVRESSIGNCCRGIYKTAGGYVWRYVL